MSIVYILKCPKTHQIKYVGEGGINRPLDHIKKVKRGVPTSNSRLTAWVKKLLDNNLEPLIEIVYSDISKKEALLIEEQLIKQYGRKGFEDNGILLNIAEKGLLYDKSGKNNPFYGKKHTKETREKMSLAKYGVVRGDKFKLKMREIAKLRPPMSKETREKISNKNRGRKNSPASRLKQSETKRANRKRKFTALTPAGEHLFFTSVHEFAKVHGLPPNSIYLQLKTGKQFLRGALAGWNFIEGLPDA